MKSGIQKELIEIIKKALADLKLDGFLPAGQEPELSLASGFGDLSTNIALRLAASAKQPPKAIAENIIRETQKHLQQASFKDHVTQIKVEGAGFINFYLSPQYFYGVLSAITGHKWDYTDRQSAGDGLPVMIEFVSANPTGALSVAHARQAAVGDALANIFLFLGYKAHKEYYLNDEGNQINILGESIRTRLRQLNGEMVDFPENYYQGDYITDMARQIKEEKLDIKDFSEYGANAILEVIRQELKDFRVEFDCWYSQKALTKRGDIEKTFAFLREKGFLYEKEGAVWFRSTDFGDDKDRVVIKSDGSYTYLAPDIAYHWSKYQRGFKLLVNLLGPDHHGYISRLKASVSALGYDPDSLNVVIVQLASIFRDGKPVEMSTRKGQYITLREVLDEVGCDASRFFFLMRKTSSHLAFDLETAKKQTPENPVYYVQYAHARISSILRQAGKDVQPESVDMSFLKEKEELDLIRKLWQFPYVLKVCAKTFDPYMLTVYLQEAAEGFHRFYDRHRVLGQDEGLTRARLALILAVKVTLATGLKLAGVSTPEQM